MDIFWNNGNTNPGEGTLEWLAQILVILRGKIIKASRLK